MKITGKKKIMSLWIILFSLSVTLHGKESDESGDLSRGDIKRLIRAKKDRPTIYWGEGITRISKDLGYSIMEAKNRARTDLSQKIEVHIISDFRSILELNENQKVSEKYRERICVYSDKVFTNLKEEYYIDYPKRGNVTYFVYIRKDDYRKQVQSDLEEKKKTIVSLIRQGKDRLKTSDVAGALRSWSKARLLMHTFFKDLPVNAKLFNGNPVDLNRKITKLVSECIALLSIEPIIPGNLQYNSNGVITPAKFDICAYYKKGGKEKAGISQIPILCEVIEGKVEANRKVLTRDYGEASIYLSKINPKYKITQLLFCLDTASIPGFSKFDNISIPTKVVTVKRKKTISVSIAAMSENTSFYKQQYYNIISALINKSGYDIIKISSLEKSGFNNADFFLEIMVDCIDKGSAGDFTNLFVATCSIQFNCYRVADKKLINSDKIESTDGYGVETNAAITDALTNLKPKIKDKILSTIRNIK